MPPQYNNASPLEPEVNTQISPEQLQADFAQYKDILEANGITDPASPEAIRAVARLKLRDERLRGGSSELDSNDANQNTSSNYPDELRAKQEQALAEEAQRKSIAETIIAGSKAGNAFTATDGNLAGRNEVEARLTGETTANMEEAQARQRQSDYEKSLIPSTLPTEFDSAFNNIGKDFVYSRDTENLNSENIESATPVDIDKTGTYTTDPETLARNRERATTLTDEQVKLVTDKTGLSAEDVRSLKPDAQLRIYKKNFEATGDGVLRTSNADESGDGGGAYSPASKPNVPSDRQFNFGVAEDTNARVGATDADIEGMKPTKASKKAEIEKQEMLAELDNSRKQVDALTDNISYKQTKRKVDDGQPLSDAESTIFKNHERMLSKAKSRVFELESKIYATEARSELGSKAASGTSDRPFKADDADPNAAMFRDNAEAKFKEAQQAELDKLEAEWRARSEARAEREAQERAGSRRQESDNSYRQEQNSQDFKYRGKKGSTESAPLESGKFPTDEFGFVKSDNGNPVQFKHQRDAGWWILKKGNKGNTGQVFEIYNHPSGQGFTVKVVKDDGAKTSASPSNAVVVKSDVKSNNDTGGTAKNAKTTDTGKSALPKPEQNEVKTESNVERPKKHPVDDRLIDDKYVGLLQTYAQEAGWSTVGGKLLRDPDTGAVMGRTTWEANADWWKQAPKTLRAKDGKFFRDAVNKTLTGDKLTTSETAAVKWVLDHADFEMRDADVKALGRELGFAPNILEGRKVVMDVEVGGKNVKIEQDAISALYDAKTRIDALRNLRNCLG